MTSGWPMTRRPKRPPGPPQVSTRTMKPRPRSYPRTEVSNFLIISLQATTLLLAPTLYQAHCIILSTCSFSLFPPPFNLALARQDPQHDHDVEACAHVKTEEQRETFQQLAHERRGSIDVARHLDELEQAGQGKEGRRAPPQISLSLFSRCNPPYDGLFCAIQSYPIVNTGVASCTECSLPVDPVDLLRAELIKSDFHSACFKCAECDEHLAHNTYYAYHRRPLCGRCHAEKFYPRCSGCDEVSVEDLNACFWGGKVASGSGEIKRTSTISPPFATSPPRSNSQPFTRSLY